MRTNSKNVHRVLNYRRNRQNPSNTSTFETIDPDVTDMSLSSEIVAYSYKQQQHPLTDAEIRKVVERYTAGASIYELADEFGCHRSTISRALKNSDITVSSKVTDRPALVARVLQMYVGGMHAKAIGTELGITPKSVSKILHDNDVRIRHSWEYPRKSNVQD